MVGQLPGIVPGRARKGSRGQGWPVHQKAKGREMFAPALGVRPLGGAPPRAWPSPSPLCVCRTAPEDWGRIAEGELGAVPAEGGRVFPPR